MRSLLKLKLALRGNPWLFKTFWTRREHGDFNRRVVQAGDDAVIEGFPRSGNTFASHAFAASQDRPIRLGNHFHSPAQFLLARRYGIPAMLVLREPLAAALSLVIFEGGTDARQALIRYVAFHRPLLPIRDSFVVAPFEEVTTDFGRSIERLNARFGTSFTPFQHDEEREKAIFDRIGEARNRRIMLGRVARNPLSSTVPAAEKEARKQQLLDIFADPSLDTLKSEATEQYQTLLTRL